MKAKVEMGHHITFNIEGDDEESIMDFLYQHTPSEIARLISRRCKTDFEFEEYFTEGIVDRLPNNARVDYIITNNNE